MPGDDYYSDAAPAQESSPSGEGADSSQPSATLPKSILAGKEFQPGDEIVLRIDKIMDDEVMVSYAPEKGGEEHEGAMEEPEPASAPSGMSSNYE